MARHLNRRLKLVFAVSCIALLGVGCQSHSSTASALPGPNFSGPMVEPQAKPAPVATAIDKPKWVPPAKQVAVPSSWVPLASAPKRDWDWIVIHHSATADGGAARFDKAHKEKGWDELGYHFVIGNGTDTADGLVEVGGRWPLQKHGAHAKTPDNRYNDHGIGICLVGNFEETRPTAKQLASLNKLVAFLADRYRIKQADIIGHKNTGKQTDCPGRNLDLPAVRAAVARQRSALVEEPQRNPGELMRSASR